MIRTVVKKRIFIEYFYILRQNIDKVDEVSYHENTGYQARLEMGILCLQPDGLRADPANLPLQIRRNEKIHETGNRQFSC